MPGPLQSLTKSDLSGGVNVTASPHQLAGNQVLRADNFQLDEQGALRVRDGMLLVDTAPDDTQRILELGTLNKVDGSVTPLAIRRRATDGLQELDVRSTTGWSTLGSFTTPYDTPTMFSFVNQQIIAAGYEHPRITNGSTFDAITPLPGAKWMLQHVNAAWAWNTNPTTTTFDGPSSIRQSDVENPLVWPTSNQLFITKDDGQEGTGLGVFTIAETGIAPLAVLIAFKTYRAYQVNGVFGGSAAPTIVPLKSDMGCVAGRTIEFIPGLQGIVRLTHKGFAVTDGLNDTIISEQIRPYIFGHDDVPGLYWPGVFRSTATQVQNPQLYVCACPIDASGQLSRVFVYDVVRQGWTIIDYPYPLATLNLITESQQKPFILGGAYNDGRVWQLFEPQQFVDTQPRTNIPWRVRFAPIGGTLQRVYVRGMALQLFQVQPGQKLTLRMAFGPVSQKQQRVFTCTVTAGASNFFDSPLDRSVESEVYFDIAQMGQVLWCEVSGTGYLAIRGVSWDVRPMARVRPIRG
jgi:hypothetical protein